MKSERERVDSVQRKITTENPEISVVIPTIPSRTVRSLPALRRQRTLDFEVIVVSDNTLDICEARNLGVRTANADLIALTDDDTEPPDNWLETAVEELDPPETVLLEGPIMEWSDPPRVYHGANLAFSSKAWEAVGGFDSRYAGWMEDCVFGWSVEEEFGRGATKFEQTFKMSHPAERRSSPIETSERLAMREFTDQYFEVMRRPSSIPGKLFIAFATKTYPYAPAIWEKVL